MRIDLPAAIREVKAGLRDAVERYASKAGPKGNKEFPPVTMIDFFYYIADGYTPPVMSINFGSDPECKPCGEWSHESFGMVEISLLQPAIDYLAEDAERTAKVALGFLRSRTVTYDEFVVLFGEHLVQLLKNCAKEGMFKSLPLGQQCQIGVEADDGIFCWPNNEGLGKVNVVVQQ